MELPKISSAFLNLTNACNLACRYCFVAQNPKKISLQTAVDAADWLAANGAYNHMVPSINFFGGEPLLMWDEVIKPLTVYIRGKYGNRFTLSMTSNCTLITEDKAEFMEKNRIGLLFSMDGAKESQDWNRPMRNGNSSFEVLEKNIPIILKHFPLVTFRSTTTPITAPHIFENFMYAKDKGFRNVFTMPNSFDEWRDDDVSVLRDQILRYAEYYVDEMRNGNQPIVFSRLEEFFGKIVLRNEAILRNEYRNIHKCSSCGKCGLGSSKNAGININGDVVACQEFFSHDNDYFVIGNIYSGVDDEKRRSLCEEWDSAPPVGDHCDSCVLNRICDGDCVANNYMLGNMHMVPKIVCEWNRIIFDAAVYIMNELGNDKNEMFKKRWCMSCQMK